jgi:hypothetical protein
MPMPSFVSMAFPNVLHCSGILRIVSRLFLSNLQSKISIYDTLHSHTK